jgi:hypothetical protein
MPVDDNILETSEEKVYQKKDDFSVRIFLQHSTVRLPAKPTGPWRECERIILLGLNFERIGMPPQPFGFFAFFAGFASDLLCVRLGLVLRVAAPAV